MVLLKNKITKNAYHFIFDVSEFGGHEMVTLSIASALAKNNKVRITAPAYNTALTNSLKNINSDIEINILGSPSEKRILYLFLLILDLIKLRKNKFTTIIPQGWPTAAVAAVIAAKLTWTNNIISYLPMWVSPTGSRLAITLKSFSIIFFQSTFSKIVTIGHNIGVNIQKHYPTMDIVTLENRIPPPFLQPISPSSARQKLGLPNKSKLVAIIGRIDFKQKGQDRFLDSILSNNEFKKFSFVFFGNGPDEKELKQRISQSKSEKYIFLKPWRKDISSLLQAFDLIVMPSRFEGVPLVMLESLISCTPFVGSREIENSIPSFKSIPSITFCDFDNPLEVLNAISLASAQRAELLSNESWQELIMRFCPDDSIYSNLCEESFKSSKK